jgi:hypothetical protein
LLRRKEKVTKRKGDGLCLAALGSAVETVLLNSQCFDLYKLNVLLMNVMGSHYELVVAYDGELLTVICEPGDLKVGDVVRLLVREERG